MTVPVGRIVLGELTTIPAESVTLSPTVEGFADETRVVVVGVKEERMVC